MTTETGGELTGSTAAARAAVHYLLTSPGLNERCRPMLEGDEVEWTALLAEAEAMSGGERLLVHVAHDLWEAESAVRIWELARRLDAANFDRVGLIVLGQTERQDKFAGRKVAGAAAQHLRLRFGA